ncbi:MAG: CBS domain-containing protein [Chloroflexi bacterium]|nr:CBS domain-containing protein [Chloroflexota bacterium]
MLVKDAMTVPAIAVRPETPVAEILRLLLERRISGVPVVDANGGVVGVVTEGDLMQRVKTTSRVSFWQSLLHDPHELAEAYLKEHGHTAAELMTKPPICALPDLPLGDAVVLMHQHRVNRLPVVADSKLTGIITRADILRAMASGATIQAYEVASSSDLELKRSIDRAIAEQPWSSRHSIRIDVENGVVTITGLVSDQSIKLATERLIEDVPGVVSVKNELSLIPYELVVY